AHVSRDVEGRKDILATRIFRRTKTFVSNKLWPILDIIVKHHQDPAVKQQILSDIELKILETIETEGTIRTDRLRKNLELEVKEKLLSDGAVLRSGPYLVSSRVRDVND